MKKMVLGLVLALAALGLIASPAMAAPAPTAADQAFLATLAAPDQTPTLAATHLITGKSACTATAICGGGLTISCAGVGSCLAADQNCAVGQNGFVQCDGRRTLCPPCPVPVS